jgi:hypothetical protein
VHPSSILAYYPTYAILDEILSYGNYKTLNLYFDLKNNLQTLYMEHAIINIVENTIRANVTDSSIFSSILSFLAFHKEYAIKRNIKVNFFIFFETGTSFYHTNIRSKYKISRRVDDLYGLEKEKRDLFFDVYQKNLRLAERVCNILPNVTLIRLQHLEADFVPYYLISRGLVDTSSKNVHVVYSNDHDLLQCLDTGDHVYIYQKSFGYKKIIKKNEVINAYLKSGSGHDNILPLLMSVIGDSGDDVDGVRGVGPKRALNMLDSLLKITGGMNQLYDNVFNKRPIFDLIGYKNLNKYLNKVIQEEQTNGLISNNMKLISFELLSRFLDDPLSLEMGQRKRQILEVLNDCKFASKEALLNAIQQLNVTIIEEDLDIIYS